ncbi:hypothetical protein GCM10027418_21500 [Mariniluteicoccus endophyticus]
MSDEIPVGSPPAPPGRHAAPAGWYADPAKAGQERYWDGWNWMRQTRPLEGAVAPQPGTGTYAGPGRPGGQPFQQAPQQPQWQNPQQGSWQGQQQPPWQGQGQWPAQAYGRAVPATADGMPLAGWWFRVLAMVIDSFVVSVVGEVVGAVTGFSAKVSAATTAMMAELQTGLSGGGPIDYQQLISTLMVPEYYWMLAINALLFVVYHALMLRFRGATLGKMACGLRVVPAGLGRHTGGLPWTVSIVRPLVYQVFNQLGVVQLVDVLFPLWDRDKQSLHDKIVKTQVVRSR